MPDIEVIKLSGCDKADELRTRILALMNEYSGMFTGYELLGIIDAVREDCHECIKAMDEE